jgi:hypothetical protein
MNKEELIEAIKKVIAEKYNGKFNAEEQRSDMYVERGNLEHSIAEIDVEKVKLEAELVSLDEMTYQELIYIHSVLI